ncbi:MAG: DNA-methyltransferase [Acetobacteraceae bacterium]
MSACFLCGDALGVLRTLRGESFQCVVTSPPYFGLRDYGTASWEGGDPGCGHEPVSGRQGGTGQRADRAFTGAVAQKSVCTRCGARRIDQQIGLEDSPEAFIVRLVEVFREVRRVLRCDGVCFVNMGDSFTPQSTHGSNDPARGAAGKPKDLLMMPFRLALALQADGWWLRSVMPWVKRSCMPESCTDRPTSAVEYVFMLTKSAWYFWDGDAVKTRGAIAAGVRAAKGGDVRSGIEGVNGRPPEYWQYTGERNFRNTDLFFASLDEGCRPARLPEVERYRHVNPRGAEGARAKRRAFEAGASYPLPDSEPVGLILDLDGDPLALDVNPHGFAGAHFATFPPKLVEPLIRAATSEKGSCPACGAPWVRVTKSWYVKSPGHGSGSVTGRRQATGANNWDGAAVPRMNKETSTTGFRPSCSCPPAEPVPCSVLDPFSGAGTVALVADRLQRDSVGIELSEAYVEMARERLRADGSLFGSEGADRAAVG